MKKIVLAVFLISLVLTPTLTQAGVVPCGLSQDDPDQEGDQTHPCGFCDFFVMINGIVKFVIIGIVPAVATLMLVIGGVMFFFGGAKPDMLTQAKGVMTSVVIGLVIIFSAWVIVNTVLTNLGIVEGSSLLRWYDIRCQ